VATDQAPWADGPGVVELPDTRRIRGRGLRRPLPAGPRPDFGVYLLAHDPGPFDWEHRWVRWPDFRTPSSTADAMAALREAHEGSATERVEVACGGGVGRTGTALAVIAALAGVPAGEAVA
jgi:protein-tyrosine phosphatase